MLRSRGFEPYHPRMVGRYSTGLVLLVVVLSSCGRGDAEEAHAPSTAPTAGEQAAPPGTTAETSGDPAPGELQGTWLLDPEIAAARRFPGPVRLQLRATAYSASGGHVHGGQIAVDGDMIEFTSSTCGETGVSGRYRWRITGGNLHLELIGNDECSGRRALLEDATYRRLG